MVKMVTFMLYFMYIICTYYMPILPQYTKKSGEKKELLLDINHPVLDDKTD